MDVLEASAAHPRRQLDHAVGLVGERPRRVRGGDAHACLDRHAEEVGAQRAAGGAVREDEDGIHGRLNIEKARLEPPHEVLKRLAACEKMCVCVCVCVCACVRVCVCVCVNGATRLARARQSDTCHIV